MFKQGWNIWAEPLRQAPIRLCAATCLPRKNDSPSRALPVLAALGWRFVAYLVIIGGSTGRDGTLFRQAVIAPAERLGVVPFVRLPAYVANASQCLPAIDVCLNTLLPGQTPQS